MEYDLYIRLSKDQSLPESIPGAEILDKEQVLGEWWKLTIRVDKDKLEEVADWLRKQGYRLARSANY